MDIGQLPREMTPPPTLEEDTVNRLRHHGYLRRPAASWWRQLAAAVAIFVAGAAGGAAWSAAPDAQSSGPRFLLLLHGGATASPEEESRVVESYRLWAAALGRSGRFVTGERLAPEAVSVPPAALAADPLQGFFIISASDLDDALAVAASAPHVQRGGRVTVRPIDTP